MNIYVYRKSSTTGNYYIYFSLNGIDFYSTGFSSYSSEDKVNEAINELIKTDRIGYINSGFQNEDVPLI